MDGDFHRKQIRIKAENIYQAQKCDIFVNFSGCESATIVADFHSVAPTGSVVPLELITPNNSKCVTEYSDKGALQHLGAKFTVADSSADFHLRPNYCSCADDLAAIAHGDAVAAAQRSVRS